MIEINEIRKRTADTLGIHAESIADDTRLADLGVDSLDLVDLLLEFKCEKRAASVAIITFRQFADYVRAV